MKSIPVARKQLAADQFQILVDSVVDYAIYMLDPSGIVLSWNSGAERMKGYSAEEIIGRHFSSFYTDEDRSSGLPAHILETARLEGRCQSEGWRLRKDGTRFWTLAVVDAIRSEAGDLIGFAKITRDITERRAAERALAENERHYREIFERAPIGMIATSPTGSFLRTNAAYRRMIGYSEDELARLSSPLDTIHPDDRKIVERNRQISRDDLTANPFGHEMRLIRKDGETIWVWITAAPIYADDGSLSSVLIHLQDITERKSTESQLFQAQKMDAIGNFAGGIAHDFNNMLVPIIGLAELTKEYLPEFSEGRENLDLILAAAEHARALVAQILTFSRQDDIKIAQIDVATSSREALGLLRNLLPATISLVSDIEDGIGTILADPAQFQSVILNLGSNAAAAMGGGTGTLAITLREVRLNGDDQADVAGLAHGRYAQLRVTDSGKGMAEETLAKIFDPFFTTKPVGEGTGLGLSMVHGIVQRSGGAIGVESKVGVGTTFNVYLPLET